MFSGAGAGGTGRDRPGQAGTGRDRQGQAGTGRDVANSETQFVIIKPPFVRPAALLANPGSRGRVLPLSIQVGRDA